MATPITEGDEVYSYDTMESNNDGPPIVPRGGGGSDLPPPPVPSRASKNVVMNNNDVYDDDNTAGVGAITMDQIYVTDEIKGQPWFVGSIDRAASESLLKQGDRLGNFLVREKVKNKAFVHSYMSLTRMTIIHNMIEFARDGSCQVDNNPWPHGDCPSLEDVIDKMQEIRRSRKNVKSVADPGFMRSVKAVWPKVCPTGLTIAQAQARVRGMRPGTFLVCGDSNLGIKGYVIIINKGSNQVHKSSCPRSAQGQYLKYSELSGSTMVDLVALILSNPDAAKAAGIPKMTIPSDAELSAEVEEIYDDVEEDAPPPPRPPPSAGRGKLPPPPPVDDVYGDNDIAPIATEEDIYDD